MLATDTTTRYRLSDLPDGVERTFWRLYEVAGARGSAGCLPRLTVRELARLVRRPHPTLLRHLDKLEEHGLVVKNLLDRVVIPLQDAEHRFSRNGRKDDGLTTTAPRRKAVREDVGGQAPRQLPILVETRVLGPPTVDRNGPPRWTTQRKKPLASDTQINVTGKSSTEISSPQDLDPGLVAQLVEALGHDVYGSLEKLARRSATWLQVLTRPGERQQLIELGARSHGALFVALQSAHDTFAPGFAGRRIENPGAWLRGTVRKILEEQSAARAEGVS